MIDITTLQKLSDVEWQISKDYRSDMRVPAKIFASEHLLDKILRDRSIDQLVNVATLPGIQEAALAMPDAHEGYGFPIGGVAATSWPDGAISPGGIGYDINCGVRLLRSELQWDDLKPHLEELGPQIARDVPAGMGQGGQVKLTLPQLDEVLNSGLEWMEANGYMLEGERQFVESTGRLIDADASFVSNDAKRRGLDQLGTLGSGNHFAELSVVDEIFDEEVAKVFGLHKGMVVVMIHTGSRGLGHQVATDYIKDMIANLSKHNISLPDKELACAPFSSEEGQAYYHAMCAAANFAWANRQLLSYQVRMAWQRILGDQGGILTTVYDVAHNIAKVEEHMIKDQLQKVIVHRKGATRSFGPNSKHIPSEYQAVGQPVFVPGSMGTPSFVMVGTEESMNKTFGSCCHGAGREMSRHQAKKTIRVQDLRESLKNKGIRVFARTPKNLAEEAPDAYKDIHQVIDAVVQSGVARKVASLLPKIVVVG